MQCQQIGSAANHIAPVTRAINKGIISVDFNSQFGFIMGSANISRSRQFTEATVLFCYRRAIQATRLIRLNNPP